MNSISKPNSYTFLLGYYDDQGEFWCTSEYTESEEHKARAAFKSYCNIYSERHVSLIQQIKTHKVIETHYPQKKTAPTVLKERYWMVEGEDRNPDYPGWQPNDKKFLSVSQAIEEAEKLSKNEGEFFKRFSVVEVEVDTIIKEVASIDAEEN
jgi:hypothetical protein